MGTFDISRINFDKTKHYTSVRMQQGRVLTDDDWNEKARIEEENQRVSNTEIIGPFGSPDDGFKINNLRIEGSLINFDILAGVLYLGGLRLQLEKLETYRSQKDWLQQPAEIDGTPSFNANERYDLIYIESWQQPVSAIEDSSLFEVALGGPDTTTRLRNMRRVHIASDIGFGNCSDAWHKLKSDWEGGKLGSINEEFELIRDITLKVTFSNTELPEDLCTPSAAGGYLGAENQAIRVQLVDENHFTWSFDNASPLYRVTVSDGNIIKMLTEPKDQYHWPLSNQVVEILPCSALLSNGEKVAEQMGHLTKVNASYDPDKNPGEFTIQDSFDPISGIEWKSRFDIDELDDQNPPEYFYLRVWNRGDDLNSDSKIPFVIDTPVTLGHTGLQITISGENPVAGDYWVIAARPETPKRVVPWELEKGIPPHGVRHFYAPLALIKWTNEALTHRNISGKIIHDCRKKFNPLTELECCCTFTVGDGKRSRGDFISIQEAIDNLPADGGKICVLPGEHIANVVIINRRQIRITGCGEHSIVRPSSDPQQISDPVFKILNSQKILIDQLTIVAFAGIGIEILDKTEPPIFSDQITIKENNILAGIHAIHIHVQEDKGGDNNIQISYNKIGMVDKADGKAAIFSIADAVLIERNRIVVIAAPEGNDPEDTNDPKDPEIKDPSDTCFDGKIAYQAGYHIRSQIFKMVRYVLLYRPSARSEKKYLAQGGIQIGGTSEKISIRENEIIGGYGNGITLGHLKKESDIVITRLNSNATSLFLYEISIEENKIMQMGLSGISTLFNFEGEQNQVTIDDITVYRNIVQLCCRQIPKEINRNMLNNWAVGGIVLNHCENGRIQENRIENNGPNSGDPICGVFVGYGEKMDISTNSIVNNGINPIDPRSGSRGGIVVRMSFKTPEIKKILDSTIPSFDGVPAVKIHNNIVNQPLGHALILMAFGPVSVVGNQFTSQGTDKTQNLSYSAGAVFILNLGNSKDIFTTGFRNLANYDPQQFRRYFEDTEFGKIYGTLQFLPKGMVMFSNNQTTLDIRSPAENSTISSQMILSMDIAFNNNQSECVGSGKENSLMNRPLTNTFLFGHSIRSNDNRFIEPLKFRGYSLFSYSFMNTATANQSDNCIIGLGTKLAINNNIVLYNDRCGNKLQAARDALALSDVRELNLE